MTTTSNAITRALWGARYANGFGPRPVPIPEFWLHHSVTVAPDLLPPFTDDDEAVRTLERIGQSRFGGGISYTFPVTPVGRVYEGLGIERRGAHTYGHNTTGAAFVLVGDYSRRAPTPQQIEAIAQTMVLAHRAGLATRHTLNGGHRDAPRAKVYPTACPGDAAMGVITTINARANALWNGGYGLKAPVTTRVVAAVSRTVRRAALSVHGGPLDAATVRVWQRVMGTPVDGIISVGRGGSALVRAVQRVVDVRVDGFLGPVTWKGIQRRLGVSADGVPGPITMTALRRRLNTGRF